ncbi:MAG: hypothetical protein IH614_04645 [Desulfuromonadales bacterium]|nr:hypothetical protein [Desulfuromonadales bacterium]
MKPYFAMGLFALYVVIISLLRVLPDREFSRLAAMKRIWGRQSGLAIHFVTNVGLPMVIGIVFLGQGIASFPQLAEQGLWAPAHHSHSLPHLQYHLPGPAPTPADLVYSGEIALLLPMDPVREKVRREIIFHIPLSP